MRFILILFNIFFHFYIFSQCKFDVNLPIPDESKTSISILVSNAQKNNLATNNKVCSVKIKFKHEAVGDLDITLISPSGQRLTLVGPSGSAALTDLTTWDVEFTQCTKMAKPDPGIASTWDNTSLWGVNQFYSGTYYPYGGCLEDFNTGPINGTWTFLIEDAEELDLGIIESVSISFCDNSGVRCTICDPIKAKPVKSKIEKCKGLSIDSSEIRYTINSGQTNLSNYKFDYVVFGKNRYLGLLSKIGTASLDTGMYTMCLLSYAKSDSLILPNSPTIKNKEEYSNAIITKGACALLNGCIDLKILPVADIKVLNYEICKGDSITLYGKTFKNEGSFFVSNNLGQCDSVFNVKVDVIEMKSKVTSNISKITCAQKQATLKVSMTENKAYTYNWFTINGNIVTDPKLSEISVNKSGMYYVEVYYLDCYTLDSIKIEADISLPKIKLEADKITCLNKSTIIRVSSTSNIVNTTWTGGPFVQTGLNIEVNRRGTYICTARDDKNCEVIEKIDIIEDIDKPRISLNITNLTCKEDSISVKVIDSFNIKSVRWLNNFPNVSKIEQIIDKPDIYKIILFGFNGCIDTVVYDVNDERYTLPLEIEGDTITCTKRSIVLKPKTNLDSLDFFWIYPSSIKVQRDSLRTIFPGEYKLIAVDTNECKGEARYYVEIDTLQPFILVSNKEITCNKDSVQLGIDNPVAGYRYLWRGPFFSSTLPRPFVKNTGLYSVLVTDVNSCTSLKFLNVEPSNDLPDVTFIVDSIGCGKDTAFIVPSDTTNLKFTWENVDVKYFENKAYGYTTLPGVKRVEVVNRVNGCSRSFYFEVVDARTYPTFKFKVDTIGCIVDSVKINFESSIVLFNLSWQGPSFSSNKMEPIVKNEGKYILTAKDEFGCRFKDSVYVYKKVDLPQILITGDTLTCDPKGAQIKSKTNDPLSTYRWFQNGIVGNSESIVSLKGGNYTLEVTNSKGCTNRKSYQVVADTIKPKFTNQTVGYINCIQKQLPLKVSSNENLISTSWKGPGIISTNILNALVNKGGFYTFIGVDRTKCADSIKVFVADSSRFIKSTLTATKITCDSSARIKLSTDLNPKLIKWNAPQAIGDNIKNTLVNKDGLYRVAITSVDECVTYDSILVSYDTITPKILKVINNILTCNQTSTTIGVNKETDFKKIKWDGLSDTTFIISVSEPKTYKGTIKGLNGCEKHFSIDVKQDVSVPAFTLKGDTIDCNKSKVDLEVVSPTNFASVKWTTPDNNILNGKKVKIEKPGLYKVLVIGNNGCPKNDSIQIVNNLTKPIIDLKDTFLLPCDYTPINLFVSSLDSLSTYRWVGINKPFVSTEKNPSVDKLMKVRLFAAGKNGCNAVDSTLIILDTLLPKFSFINDTIKCFPRKATIRATGINDDRKTEWTLLNGSKVLAQNIETSIPGIYQLKVTGQNGCEDSVNINVAIDTLRPKVNLISPDLFYCDNREVRIIANVVNSRPIESNWTTNTGNFTLKSELISKVNKSGKYYISVKDKFSRCENNDSIQLNYIPNTNLDFSYDFEHPVCKGDETGSISIKNIKNAFGPTSYQINNKPFSKSLNFNNLQEGKYRITVKDSLGCLNDTVIILNPGFTLDLLLPGDTIIDLGKPITVSFQTNPKISNYNYAQWSISKDIVCPDCDDFTFEPTEDVLLTLLLVDSLGCKYEKSIKIDVNTSPIIDIPNVISPNGDESNRIFFIPEYPSIEKVLFLRVYDNWGNLLHNAENFDAGDRSMGWDGRAFGKLVNPGVYVLNIGYKFKDGRIKNIVRDLTVLR